MTFLLQNQICLIRLRGKFRTLPKFFNSLGITHRLSCPHTHQQYDAIERKHRHIVETGLAFLSHAHVPLQY